ncbi:MAG TPA: hypothetical protein VJP84_07590 [Steroidobacteraceae bacterium]|jgi:hypothetical protein|nr:hypothetical protein [Steroidobacteraceae bacterium]
MMKVSETDSQIVYRRGSRFSLAFVILIPVAILARVFLEVDWLPVWVMTFMGVVMAFVGGMREEIVFDVVTRAITCTESFYGRMLRSEVIPLDRVTRLYVEPHYERPNERRSLTYQSGFQLRLAWQGEWGGGGMLLGIIWDEAEAMREAERFAHRIGTKVERLGTGTSRSRDGR